MSNSGFVMSDQAYKGSRRLVQVILPAFATLVSGVFIIWSIPYEVQIVGTITLITTFLGVLLGVSGKNYDEAGYKYDGTMQVLSDPGGLVKASMNLDKSPDSIIHQKEVRFRVENGIYDHEAEDAHTNARYL